MKNNVLGKIQMQSAKLPPSRFNMANDVSTSTQFGVVSPTHVRYMHAGTKKVVSDEALYYLAPLVCPTFSRLKAKLYHQFVRISDLFPRTFNAMLSETPVGLCVGGIQKPNRLPYIDIRLLSCFALFGSKLTIFYGDKSYTAGSQSGLADLAYDTKVTTLHVKDYPVNPNNDTELWAAFTAGSSAMRECQDNGVVSGRNTIFSKSNSNEAAAWSTPSLNAFGCKCPSETLLFDPFAFYGMTQPSGGKCLIPLGQQFWSSAAGDPNYTSSEIDAIMRVGQDINGYNPETSDVVITKYFDYTTTSGGATTWHRRRFYYCFRLSDYGKRFKSFLEGVGYKLNFTSVYDLAFAPLAAAYKAYYNLFSINLYENWDNSTFGYVCNNIDNGAFASLGNSLDSDLKTVNSVGGVARCVFAFGDTFYTEEQDYLSAHTDNLTISPAAPKGMIRTDVVTPIGSNINTPDSSGRVISNPNPNIDNGHAMINSANHGQLDAEFLMKAYRWVNRNSIAGQRVAEILRAQGHGDYVDTCKPDFIGYDETLLVINEVVSQSDTYSPANNTGAQLGQRGAKGIGYNEGKKVFEFIADEIGFWVTLSVIVPNSGYCQGIDPVNANLTRKEFFYIPDFDAMGMERTQFISILDHSKDDGRPSQLLNTFGYVPQMSRFKVARNKLAGCFSLASVQDNFLPYTLDKVIAFDKLQCSEDTHYAGQYDIFNLANPVTFSDIPSAGEAWRYIGKYLYLQNFNRMFSYQGESSKLMTGANGNNWSEFVIRDADNFFYHLIDNDQTYAHMKPIELSYETDDEGKTNTSMDKA